MSNYKSNTLISCFLSGSLLFVSCGGEKKAEKLNKTELTEVKSFTEECVKSPSKYDKAIDGLMKTVGLEERDEKSCKLAAHKLFQKDNLKVNYTGEKQISTPFKILSGFTNVKNLEIVLELGKDKKDSSSFSKNEIDSSGIEKLSKLKEVNFPDINNKDSKQFVRDQLEKNFDELNIRLKI